MGKHAASAVVMAAAGATVDDLLGEALLQAQISVQAPERQKAPAGPSPAELAAELQRPNPDQTVLFRYLESLRLEPPARADLNPWQKLLKDPGGKVLSEFVLQTADTLLTEHGPRPEYLNFASMALHISNFKLKSAETQHVISILKTADLSELPLYQRLKLDYSLARYGESRSDIREHVREAESLREGADIDHPFKVRHWLGMLQQSQRDQQRHSNHKRPALPEPVAEAAAVHALAEKCNAGGQFGKKDFEKGVIPALAVHSRLGTAARADCAVAVDHYKERLNQLSDTTFDTLVSACNSGRCFHPAIGAECIRRLAEHCGNPESKASDPYLRRMMQFAGLHGASGNELTALLEHSWTAERADMKVHALILFNRLLCHSLSDDKHGGSAEAMYKAVRALGQEVVADRDTLSAFNSGTVYEVANALYVAGIGVPPELSRWLVLQSNFTLTDTRDEARIGNVLAGDPDVASLVNNGRVEEAPWIHPDVSITLKDGRRFAVECDGHPHFYHDMSSDQIRHWTSDTVTSMILSSMGVEVIRLDFRDFPLADDEDLRQFLRHRFRAE